MLKSTRPLVTKLTVFYACQLKAMTERYLEKAITEKINYFFTNLPTDHSTRVCFRPGHWSGTDHKQEIRRAPVYTKG